MRRNQLGDSTPARIILGLGLSPGFKEARLFDAMVELRTRLRTWFKGAEQRSIVDSSGRVIEVKGDAVLTKSLSQ